MFGSFYPGQNYPAQGYAGDQSGLVYTFADVVETSIDVTAGARRLRSAKVARDLSKTSEIRTIGETV